MKSVTIPVCACAPDWSDMKEYSLSNHLWPQAYPAYYSSCVRFCAVEGKGLFVRFQSEEPLPRAVCTNRDDPVYNDSCMELFLQPVQGDSRYINVEINPAGVYLSEIGTCRSDRIFLKDVTDLYCETTVSETDTGWAVELFLPDALIADVFGTEFSFATVRQLKLNVYKCGEKTEYPHYSSLFNIETPKPDYHRPEFFGTANFVDERIN